MPLIVVALLGSCLVSAAVAVGLGAVRIPIDQVVRIVLDHFTPGAAAPGGPTDYIVWQLRAPRVLEALAVGAGLAVSGAVAQVVVANPLADPYVLGLSSGAGVGAVLVITTIGTTAAGGLTLPLAAFVGALLTGVVVFAAARRGGQLTAGRLVLVGVALGYLLSGLTSFLLLRKASAEATQQVMFWLLGSLAGAQWRFAVVVTAVVAAGTLALVMLAGRLNLLSLGDEAATALGQRPHLLRTGLFVLVALLVGSVVSVSGSIGFVGLVVPNLVRLALGADHRRTLPVTALLGALLTLWADTGARLLLAPTEMPIGILTAVIGVPVFVFAVRRSRSGLTG